MISSKTMRVFLCGMILSFLFFLSGNTRADDNSRATCFAIRRILLEITNGLKGPLGYDYMDEFRNWQHHNGTLDEAQRHQGLVTQEMDRLIEEHGSLPEYQYVDGELVQAGNLLQQAHSLLQEANDEAYRLAMRPDLPCNGPCDLAPWFEKADKIIADLERSKSLLHQSDEHLERVQNYIEAHRNMEWGELARTDYDGILHRLEREVNWAESEVSAVARRAREALARLTRPVCQGREPEREETR